MTFLFHPHIALQSTAAMTKTNTLASCCLLPKLNCLDSLDSTQRHGAVVLRTNRLRAFADDVERINRLPAFSNDVVGTNCLPLTIHAIDGRS